MSEQRPQEDRAGSSDHEQERVGKNEGVRAPLGEGETSIFDGKGNEMVTKVVVDEEGRTKQGTGTSSEAAKEEALKGEDSIGVGHHTDPHAHPK